MRGMVAGFEGAGNGDVGWGSLADFDDMVWAVWWVELLTLSAAHLSLKCIDKFAQ